MVVIVYKLMGCSKQKKRQNIDKRKEGSFFVRNLLPKQEGYNKHSPKLVDFQAKKKKINYLPDREE